MHISSLPSPYGIGTFGEAARDFIDFLNEGGVRYWQVLPLGPTSYGDSPYQSFSSQAGNPYLIDLELLIKQGYLSREACETAVMESRKNQVDYALLYENRIPLLTQAAEKFLEINTDSRFLTFCQENAHWLDDYVLFMALKDAHKGAPWYQWEEELKRRDFQALDNARAQYHTQMQVYQVLQYLFYQQWKALKEYAHEHQVFFIGDIPIYVAYDSVEVWKEPGLFSLDEKLQQVYVAGCPPDAFDENGQLWGNPIYRWDKMKENGYQWWADRLGHVLQMYDMIRIDHFRGFASYYQIPAEDTDAKRGQWQPGPGMDFFHEMNGRFGEMPIIAEDLGYITEDVKALLRDTGYPGMKVLQFAFDEDNGWNAYLPHNYERNCVVYPGTHDNTTLVDWLDKEENAAKHCKDYLGLSQMEGAHWGMIRGALSSVADLAVIPMQDLLGLDGSARMNTPSTIGDNWNWRMKPQKLQSLAKKLQDMNIRYRRT